MQPRCSLDPSRKNVRPFERFSIQGGRSLAKPQPEARPPPPGHARLGMRALGQAPVIAKSNQGRVDIIRHCYFEHAISLHYERFHSLVSRSSPIINVLPAVFRHLTNISLAVDHRISAPKIQHIEGLSELFYAHLGWRSRHGDVAVGEDGAVYRRHDS